MLARAIGKTIPPDVELIFGETDDVEPVRAGRADDALPAVRPLPRRRRGHRQGPKQSEHGFRHTAIIHSNNVRQHDQDGQGAWTPRCSSRTARAWPALGLGGEGYISFSIAGPTGEGVTTPLTFTRERRCSMIDNLRILGKVSSRSCVQLRATAERAIASRPCH